MLLRLLGTNMFLKSQHKSNLRALFFSACKSQKVQANGNGLLIKLVSLIKSSISEPLKFFSGKL